MFPVIIEETPIFFPVLSPQHISNEKIQGKLSVCTELISAGDFNNDFVTKAESVKNSSKYGQRIYSF